MMQDYGNFEIVVVDSSTNEQSKEITSKYPGVKYTRFYNGKNMAVSRNIGINNARGEIAVFIDDDCYVQGGWLNAIVEGFSNETIGGVGGRVIDESQTYYTADTSKVGRIYPSGMLSGFHDYTADKPFFVDYIAGGNMAFRRDILTKLGGFDPVFRVWNDVDISMRVRNVGYAIVSNPRMSLEHKTAKREFIKRDRTNFSSQCLYNRNHAYCMFKNGGFRFAYFKTLFYWKVLDTLRNAKNKKAILLIAQLCGVVMGIALAVRVKIVGEGNHL